MKFILKFAWVGVFFTMVLVHIICKHQLQCDEIIDLLLEEKLVLDAWVSEKALFMNRANQDKSRKNKQILIMCKTKALLFNAIDKALTARFPKNMPVLYCVPIIYMNAKQAERLRTQTLKV